MNVNTELHKSEKILGENLRRWRKSSVESEVTQEQAAYAVGIKQASWSRYENGKTMPNGLELVKIARVLGVTAENLLEPNFGGAAPIKRIPESENYVQISQEAFGLIEEYASNLGINPRDFVDQMIRRFAQKTFEALQRKNASQTSSQPKPESKYLATLGAVGLAALPEPGQSPEADVPNAQDRLPSENDRQKKDGQQ